METTTNVTYNVYTTPFEIKRMLDSLPDTIACDFETGSKFSAEHKERLKAKLEHFEQSSEEYRLLTQAIASSGLSHPSLVTVTHMSIAESDSVAHVIIFLTPHIEKLVMNWLVTTTRTQIWHNLSFDGKLIYHRTNGQLPNNYEDTQILAKSLLNHVDNFKSQTGLKHLMSYKYGSWAVAADNFAIENLRDEKLLEYAGTDSCATMALWQNMQEFISKNQ